MKRAKVMLMAIAVFAVLGGALAFKAQSFTTVKTFYSYGKIGTYTGCVLPFTTKLYVITAAPAGVNVPYSSVYTSTLVPADCTAQVTLNGAE